MCKGGEYQFQNKLGTNDDVLWRSYQEGKQTISELTAAFGVSDASIKRRLRKIEWKWFHVQLEGNGYVHLDVTYWGHKWEMMLALDESSGKPFYMAIIAHE